MAFPLHRFTSNSTLMWDNAFPRASEKKALWRHQMKTFSALLALHSIHRSSVNSPHQGQWHGAMIFSLVCAWTNGCAKNRDPGDLRCHCAHYHVTEMLIGNTPRPSVSNMQDSRIHVFHKEGFELLVSSCCEMPNHVFLHFLKLMQHDKGFFLGCHLRVLDIGEPIRSSKHALLIRLLPSKLSYKAHHIPKLTCFTSRLAAIPSVQLILNRHWFR